MTSCSHFATGRGTGFHRHDAGQSEARDTEVRRADIGGKSSLGHLSFQGRPSQTKKN